MMIITYEEYDDFDYMPITSMLRRLMFAVTYAGILCPFGYLWEDDIPIVKTDIVKYNHWITPLLGGHVEDSLGLLIESIDLVNCVKYILCDNREQLEVTQPLVFEHLLSAEVSKYIIALRSYLTQLVEFKDIIVLSNPPIIHLVSWRENTFRVIYEDK